MLYVFFWVIPRRLNFISRRFGTLSVPDMEQIDCSETSAYKIQRPGNHPEKNIHHTFILQLKVIKKGHKQLPFYAMK
jgi:hypothetical protein